MILSSTGDLNGIEAAKPTPGEREIESKLYNKHGSTRPLSQFALKRKFSVVKFYQERCSRQ